jgi:hypothetical protein
MRQSIVYPSPLSPESLIGSVIRVGGAAGGGAHFAVVGVEDTISSYAVGKRLLMVNSTGETFKESWGFVLRCLSIGVMVVDQEAAWAVEVV